MSTIREAIESAYEAASAEANAEAPPEAEAPPPPEATAAEDAGPAALSAEAPPGQDAPPEAAKTQRARDGAGRFAREGKAKASQLELGAPAKAATPAPSPTAPAASATPAPAATPKPAEAQRAPRSWTPEEREHFGKAPPEVQRAILRQDAEVQRVLRESAPARKFHEAFGQVTAPYTPMLGGTEPLVAVRAMLQTVGTLHAGSQAQKAGLVANLIRNYGVDIQSLASALDGQPARGGQAAGGAPVDAQSVYQHVRQQLLQDFSQQAQRQQAAAADAEVAQFAQGHEFLDDVAEDMAGLIDSAKRRGIALSYEDAYTRACKAHPEISQVLAQREAAAAATASQAATQRARAAASSVRTQPAQVPNGTEKRTLRGTIEAVAAELSGH